MFIPKDYFICGIDEAGRGPLAGPVYAGAVILPETFPVEILNDSKKLSEKKRLKIEPIILEKAIAYGIGFATQIEIDKINILNASLLAMERAYINLLKKLNQKRNIFAIIDGTKTPNIDALCCAEPKADGKYPSVMAASILAKNERDRVMIEYSKQYPAYKYEKHKGYPTKEHIKICKTIGPSPIQRLSFKY